MSKRTLNDSQLRNLISDFRTAMQTKMVDGQPKDITAFSKIISPLIAQFAKSRNVHRQSIYLYTKKIRQDMLTQMFGKSAAKKHIIARAKGGKTRHKKARVKAAPVANLDSWKVGIAAISNVLGLDRATVRDMAVDALRESIRNEIVGE